MGLLGLMVLPALAGCVPTPVCRVDLSQPAPVIGWRDFFSDPDLRELIEVALAANLDLRIATQRLGVAQVLLDAAGAAMLPTVSAIADVGIRRFGLYTMDGAGNLGVPLYRDREVPRDIPDYRIGLVSRWEVDLWGRLSSAQDASLHRLLATEEARALVQTGLISQVATLYYELLARDAEFSILDGTVELQRRSLQAVEVQRAVGAANELVRQQFEARLHGLEAERARVKVEVAAIEATINGLCGRMPQAIRRGAVPLDATSLPALADTIAPELLRNRPDVRRAELDVAAADADVQAARAAFYPRLAVDGMIGLQAFRPDLLADRRSTTYGLLGGIVAPIFNRAEIQAEFVGATAAQLEALWTYQQTVVESYLELHNLLATIKMLDEVRAAHDRETTVAAASIAVANELFRVGRSTFIEVLGVQQVSLDARIKSVLAKKEQLLNVVALYRALGGGAYDRSAGTG